MDALLCGPPRTTFVGRYIYGTEFPWCRKPLKPETYQTHLLLGSLRATYPGPELYLCPFGNRIIKNYDLNMKSMYCRPWARCPHCRQHLSWGETYSDDLSDISQDEEGFGENCLPNFSFPRWYSAAMYPPNVPASIHEGGELGLFAQPWPSGGPSIIRDSVVTCVKLGDGEARTWPR